MQLSSDAEPSEATSQAARARRADPGHASGA